MPNALTMDQLPEICGSEKIVAEAMERITPSRARDSAVENLAGARSAFAIALHMHQPLIPAGGNAPLSEAPVVSNLQFMLEHPEVPDAHNATVFIECYKRMANFLRELVAEGKRPRVMLDYSGCLLHGLVEMGRSDVIDELRAMSSNPQLSPCVEWLATAWGHAVAPSTPPADFRLHVRAWQYHFADLFGVEALSRVRGFSPPEMALPNHPDTAFEFVKTLIECGFRWVLVQEHTIESTEGGPVTRPHLPHRLVTRNSRGETAEIVAIIKTQGSDTKLVGQMQPYYEAKGLSPIHLAGYQIPPLATQIADGENGGVMMNEFPPKFMQVMREASGSPTPPVTVSEYLHHLKAIGVRDDDLPAIHPIFHKRIFDRFKTDAGPEQLDAAIESLRKEDGRFHVEGGSWTSNISWTKGYDGVLNPMAAASQQFHQTFNASDAMNDPRYREALFYLMLCQTSCFRYWGAGQWTDFGRELCRRAQMLAEPAILDPATGPSDRVY